VILRLLAAANRVARDALAKKLEDAFLDEGYNIEVHAIGKDHTTLRLEWILASKAFAHQLSQRNEFFDNARSVGFKRIEITALHRNL
jgi:hypothetical protein